MFLGTLYPYQEEAVAKMVDRKRVLVAYDLGLGKTPITIAAVESLFDSGDITDPVLVVCLSSLKYQWQKEIHKFSDSAAIVIDGTPKQREQQYVAAMDRPYDYVVVNYEQVVNDWSTIGSMTFGAIILDEATAIKAFRSKRSRRVKAVAKTVPVRFGLTGTPIENGKPEELYSIMEAIDPALLGTRFDLFDSTFIVRGAFGQVQRYRNLEVLHQRLAGSTVRKTQLDPDVAPFLPDTIVRDPLWVPLDRYGALVYRRIALALQADLEEASATFGTSWSVDVHYGRGSKRGFDPADAMRGRVMSKITALRMLCDHPRLIEASAQKYTPYSGEGSEFLSEFLSEAANAEALSRTKPQKLSALVPLVRDHLDADDRHKVVIFTSYVEMASIIRDAVGGVVYTGAMNSREKEAMKVQFQTDPDTRVLVSSDAGGYGVDLPQANLLINYDLPWSAGLATQRNGRIRRASSTWPSIVIQDVLMAETVEARQYEMLQHKTAVASAVVDGKGINEDGGVDTSVGGLGEFLRDYQP